MTPILLALAVAAAPFADDVPAQAGAPAEPAAQGAPEPVRQPRDLEAARIAWRYFERNTDPRTGLVASVEGYPSTTAWDLGSSIIATIAARELGLVEPGPFALRVRKLLRTLRTMPLFDGAMPNKAYDVRNAQMTDYANHPAPGGIGFSSVDVGRLVSALTILGDRHPEHRLAAERVLARLDPCRAAKGGELRGVHADARGRLREDQEGRLGYEQYAAKAFALLGADVSRARRYDRYVSEVSLLGVKVPRDARDFRRYGAIDPVTTDPWVLDAFEFGPDPAAASLEERVFEVQKRRFAETGIPTAVSEDHVDRAPWFVYGAIWVDGAPWRAVTPEGKDASSLRGLSTKAAFALAVLHPDDPYAAVLRNAIRGARDPERGWYAGTYELGGINRTLSANTNGIVLEAVLFERTGPFGPLDEEGGWFRERLAAMGRRCPLASGSASGEPLPGGAAVVPGSRGTSLAVPKASRARVNGFLVTDYRGPEGPGFGGMITAWPVAGLFLRFGAEATPLAKGGPARLLWGFGYDDWRDGTFSATVHNWGPVYPQDGPGVRQAELNLAYKVPRLCSDWLCGQLQPYVTVPFSGGPYAGGRLTLTYFRTWFVMAGVGWTPPNSELPADLRAPAGTPRWRLFYGFGRWDWKPGSIFVTYHDWGPDWRAHNGILAFGVNWQF